MTETKKKIPALRFPEFSGEWEEKRFGEVYTFRTTNSYSRDNLNYKKGYLKNIHYGDIHVKYKTLFDVSNEDVPYINEEVNINKIPQDNYCKKNDLIIADASEDYSGIGKTIEIINTNNEKIVAGLHTILARPDLYALASGFGGYIMKNEKITLQIKKHSQGIKVLGLSSNRLSEISLFIPMYLEQQKIAEFLSSIDERIQLLKEKKKQLETYKKGMMQKIFNQEIRFKDENGNNYPDWEEKGLGEVCNFQNGKAHENCIDSEGEYIVVNSKFISTRGKIKKFTHEQIHPLLKEQIVMVMSDVPKGKALGKCFYIDKDNLYTLNQRICSLFSETVNNKFIFYLIDRNPYFLSFDSGVGQTNLRKEDVLDCTILVPNSLSEQQKIANFLSAIDDKIEMCNNQITENEQYKKGLLQQMFV